MAEQKDRLLGTPDKFTSNRVILDGTSYSGADIKAVIHIYGQKGRLLKITELQNRLQELQQFHTSLSIDLSAVENTALGLIPRISLAGFFLPNTVLTIENKQRLLKKLSDEIQINDLKIRSITEEATFLANNQPPFVTKTLAEIQTLSVSTYREKYPVRSLGTTYPKGFTRGPRTIAGSMVFTVFDKNVLYELLAADPSEFDADRLFSTAIIDQLPPFDITISFANELGQLSRMTIYGVEFVSEGQTMSIHDLFIENTAQYIARDIDPMTKDGDLRRRVLGESTKLGSDLLKETSAQEYKKLGNPFERFTKRSNPFK